MVAYHEFCTMLFAVLTHRKYVFVISCSLSALWIRADYLLGELKDAASRDVSRFSCCAACSSSSSRSCRKGSSKRQVLVGASENPALQSGAGEFPVVTTKPTIIRMLVCHRGVSLFGCELCFLPPCESRIIYFGSLRVSFPLSGKRLPPFPPSPSFLSPPS